MKNIAQRLLATFGLTVATVAISEAAFWGRWRPEDSVASYLELVLIYMIPVWLTRVAIEKWRLNDRRLLFVAGALFGWMVEGVLVAATYEALPLSISWTALGWHALLSVVWLWDVFPRWMMSRPWMPLVAGVGVGSLQGAWAITWWTEDPTRTAPASFALYTAATAVTLVTGFGLWQRTRSPHPLSLRAAKWGIAALAPWGAAAVFIPLPLAIPVAAFLFGGSMWMLKDRKHIEPGRSSYLSTPRVPWIRLAAFATSVTAAAVATYTVAYNTNVLVQTSIWVFAATVPVGFWLLFRGLRAARRPSAAAIAALTPPATM